MGFIASLIQCMHQILNDIYFTLATKSVAHVGVSHLSEAPSLYLPLLSVVLYSNTHSKQLQPIVIMDVMVLIDK